MPLRDQLQQTLGDAYRLEQELGGGGMSRVFVATDVALDRRVVVKVLPAEMSGQLSVERFKREISIAARLQHPHIVPLLAAGEVDGLPYFTMPYVEGESLRARLSSRGQLPLPDAIRVLREVASALAYAHSHDVVHRDIKPDNVLLSAGAAMVTDFGVAKAVSAAGPATSEGLTSVGIALGTPAYMAPEQAAADPNVDHRADIYAWGMMAYEILSGQSPFAGRTPQALLAAQLTETPEPISKRRAGLSPALSSLVMRSLEKAPSDRPQRADELVRGLDAIITPSGGDVPGGRVAAVGSPSAAGRIAVVGIAVVLLAGSGIWYAKRGGNGPSTGPADMTLAVLPIENLGGDSTTEYLADGMTGELSSALKKVPGLQVAGDLSTFRFKGKHIDPADIARQLGVRMLLTGKLTPGKGRVRLQMQLSSPDGKQLWSNTYTTESKDNFAMEDTITAAIASEMRAVLSPTTLAATRAGRTENGEAHDLFMRGVFEKNKVTPQGLALAIKYFGDALKLDPHYAQAHAGMAFAYDMLADGYRPSHEYHVLALQAARKAVENDSLLAEAHALYGFELASANWDFPGGRLEMERGLALNPNSPDVVFQLAVFALLIGDIDRAISLSDRLIRIDPLSPLAARLKAEALQWGGRNEEALVQDRVATKLDPTVVIFESTSGNALRELGRFDESVQAFVDFERLFDQPSWGRAVTYGRIGKRAEALRIIRTFEERAKKQWVDPSNLAFMYAAIGDRDHAMEWLEKAVDMKTFSARAFLNRDNPWLRGLKDDPRYVALQKKVLATTFKS